MSDWKKLRISHLKRLIKSRSGRIAELQIEIRQLEKIIDLKLDSGEFDFQLKGDSSEKEEEKPESVPVKTETPEPPPAQEKPENEINIKKKEGVKEEGELVF